MPLVCLLFTHKQEALGCCRLVWAILTSLFHNNLMPYAHRVNTLLRGQGGQLYTSSGILLIINICPSSFVHLGQPFKQQPLPASRQTQISLPFFLLMPRHSSAAFTGVRHVMKTPFMVTRLSILWPARFAFFFAVVWPTALTFVWVSICQNQPPLYSSQLLISALLFPENYVWR